MEFMSLFPSFLFSFDLTYTFRTTNVSPLSKQNAQWSHHLVFPLVLGPQEGGSGPSSTAGFSLPPSALDLVPSLHNYTCGPLSMDPWRKQFGHDACPSAPSPCLSSPLLLYSATHSYSPSSFLARATLSGRWSSFGKLRHTWGAAEVFVVVVVVLPSGLLWFRAGSSIPSLLPSQPPQVISCFFYSPFHIPHLSLSLFFTPISLLSALLHSTFSQHPLESRGDINLVKFGWIFMRTEWAKNDLFAMYPASIPNYGSTKAFQLNKFKNLLCIFPGFVLGNSWVILLIFFLKQFSLYGHLAYKMSNLNNLNFAKV